MDRIYSFMEKSKTKEETEEIIKQTDKELKHTHGLSYRNPTINKVPVDKTEAINILYENSLIDVEDYEDYILLNTYSGNDLW